MPKIVHPIIQKKIRLDSIAFVDNPKNPKIYVISDRENRNEHPKVHVSLIKEGKKMGTNIDRDWQLRFAISGETHKEKLSYFKIDPKNWQEFAWIIFPKWSIMELIEICRAALEVLSEPTELDYDHKRFLSCLSEFTKKGGDK